MRIVWVSMKLCTKCNIHQVPSEFQKGRRQCKTCRRRYFRDSGTTKNAHLKRTYGIDLTQYNQLLIEQNSCCKICKRHRSELTQDLHTDHDHKTGKVRGLLCFNCNQGLGNFKDSKGLLISAFEYLK